jgi:hypothetical protein
MHYATPWYFYVRVHPVRIEKSKRLFHRRILSILGLNRSSIILIAGGKVAPCWVSKTIMIFYSRLVFSRLFASPSRKWFCGAAVFMSKKKAPRPPRYQPPYSHLPIRPHTNLRGTVVACDRCYRLPNSIKLHVWPTLDWDSDNTVQIHQETAIFINLSRFQRHRPNILLCKFIPSYYELLLSKI